ncbi:MAG TPA: hypothetical protein VGR29_01910 [Thermomicrobiales bacterium]|nr:hypothetical protein [Thermomicrobiales bacterium]
MRYTTTDPLTGSEAIVEHQPDGTYTVSLSVPAYDGTDDAEALKMQVRAAHQVFLALDAIARAMSNV